MRVLVHLLGVLVPAFLVLGVVVWLVHPAHEGTAAPDLAAPSAGAAEIRAALDTGDPAVTEATLAGLQAAATEAGTAEDFWNAFRRALATSRPDRLAAIAAWRQALPDSALAMTAEAVARAHLAALRRGGTEFRFPEAYSHADDPQLVRASELAVQAIAADKSMVAAYFVVFEAQHAGILPRDPDPFVRKLLSVVPSREGLLAATLAYATELHSNLEGPSGLCVDHAGRIPGYSPDGCMMEFVFQLRWSPQMMDGARQVLARSSDPAFDRWRLRELLWYDNDAISADRAMAYNWRRLDEGQNPIEWFGEAAGVAGKANDPGYRERAEARAAEAREAWLVDDPLDRRMIQAVLEPALYRLDMPTDPDVLDRLRRYWLNGMVIDRENRQAWDSWQMWMLGARLTAQQRGVEDAYPYMVNAIATGENNIYAISSSLQLMTEAEDEALALREQGLSGGRLAPDPEATLAFLQCPMARVARLFTVTCRANPNVGSVCTTHPSFLRAQEWTARVQTDGICPEVAAMRPTDLPFSRPVEVPEVAEFLAGFELGLD